VLSNRGWANRKPDLLSQALEAVYQYGIVVVSLILVLAGALLLLLPGRVTTFEAAVGTAFLAIGTLSVLWNAVVDRWQMERLRRLKTNGGHCQRVYCPI
jgi:uncharacterized membrane protein YphA (DoxX/SURF4 family)